MLYFDKKSIKPQAIIQIALNKMSLLLFLRESMFFVNPFHGLQWTMIPVAVNFYGIVKFKGVRDYTSNKPVVNAKALGFGNDEK